MSGVSEHFFEDSPTSRSAIGNIVFICVLLSHAHQFERNNTNKGTPSKTKRDTALTEATAHFQTLMKDLPNTSPEQCIEKFQPALVDVCNATLDASEECDHYVNNGIWDVCQSLSAFDQCDSISYTYSTEDYFRHPAFYGGCGFLIGCLLALIALLSISICCSRCKNKKNLKNEGQKGSGSGTVEDGKGSKVSSDTKNSKNSSDENNEMIGGKTVKPSVPKSQYIGDEFSPDGGKKSVFIGAKTVQKPVKSVRKGAVDKSVKGGVNKKRKNKYGKDVGALTAMEVTMYK
ncbi:unnamed protein product [Caenorhabditis brenneri]